MRMMRFLGAAWIGAFMAAPTLAENVPDQNEEPKYTIQHLIDDLMKEEDKTLEIQEDVLVVLKQGVLFFNSNYDEARATMLALTKYCGLSGHPVLLRKATGSTEVRWCKGAAAHYVAADIYQYSGAGSLYLAGQNKSIPCATAGIPVIVYVQACP